MNVYSSNEDLWGDLRAFFAKVDDIIPCNTDAFDFLWGLLEKCKNKEYLEGVVIPYCQNQMHFWGPHEARYCGEPSKLHGDPRTLLVKGLAYSSVEGHPSYFTSLKGNPYLVNVEAIYLADVLLREKDREPSNVVAEVIKRQLLALAQNPYLAGILEIDLSGCGVTDIAFQKLLDSSYLQHLTSLNLSRNSLTDVSLVSFAASLNLPNLQRLTITSATRNYHKMYSSLVARKRNLEYWYCGSANGSADEHTSWNRDLVLLP